VVGLLEVAAADQSWDADEAWADAKGAMAE
jgi:hypothetical protein